MTQPKTFQISPNAGFNFNMCRGHVDWKRIEDLDIDLLIKHQDLDLLDSHICNILKCNLLEENFKVLDSKFIKLFRLAQLAVEFLYHNKVYLKNSVADLEKNVTELNEELRTLKSECQEKRVVIKSLKRKVKDIVFESKYNSLRNYQLICRMCGDSFCDNNAQYHASRGDFNTMSKHFVNSVGAEVGPESMIESKCDVCGKVFVNRLYLYNHQVRRHPDHITKNLLSSNNEAKNMQTVSNNDVVDGEREQERKELLLQLEIKQLKERLNVAESKLQRSELASDVYYKGEAGDNRSASQPALISPLSPPLESGELPATEINHYMKNTIGDNNSRSVFNNVQFKEDVKTVRNMLQNEIKKLKEGGSTKDTQKITLQSSGNYTVGSNIPRSRISNAAIIQKDVSVNTDIDQITFERMQKNNLYSYRCKTFENNEVLKYDDKVSEESSSSTTAINSDNKTSDISGSSEVSQQRLAKIVDETVRESISIGNKNSVMVVATSEHSEDVIDNDNKENVDENVNKNDVILVKQADRKKNQSNLLHRLNESEAGMLLMKRTNRLAVPTKISFVKSAETTTQETDSPVPFEPSNNDDKNVISDINSVSSIEELSIGIMKKSVVKPEDNRKKPSVETKKHEPVKKRSMLMSQKSVWNDGNDHLEIIQQKIDRLRPEIVEDNENDPITPISAPETPVILITEYQKTEVSSSTNSSGVSKKDVDKNIKDNIVPYTDVLDRVLNLSSSSNSSIDVSSVTDNDKENKKDKSINKNENDDTELKNMYLNVESMNESSSFEGSNEDQKNDLEIKSDVSALSSQSRSHMIVDVAHKMVASDENNITIGDYDVSDSSGNETDGTENHSDTSTNVIFVKQQADQAIPSVKKLLESNPEIFDSLRVDLQGILDRRLRDLGIDPEWTSLPDKTFKNKMGVLKHHMKITAKRYKSYYSLQKQIEDDLEAHYNKKYGLIGVQPKQNDKETVPYADEHKDFETSDEDDLGNTSQDGIENKQVLPAIPQRQITVLSPEKVLPKRNEQVTHSITVPASGSSNIITVTRNPAPSSSMIYDLESDVDDQGILTMYGNVKRGSGKDYLSETESSVTNTSQTLSSADFNTPKSPSSFNSAFDKTPPSFYKGALKPPSSGFGRGSSGKKKRVLFLDEALTRNN